MQIIFALGLGAIIGIGLYKSHNQPTTTITAYNNTIVNVGAPSDLIPKKN